MPSLRWLFHPLIFYPLAAIFVAIVVLLSLQPQSWPRSPAPVAASIADGALVFEGEGFNSPDAGPEQNMTVVRDILGRAQTLRIAQKVGQPPPTPAERGVRLLLTADDAARLKDRAATVEVTYNPSLLNSADGLAVSLQGTGPAEWVGVSTPPEPKTVRFELPQRPATDAIGLRVLSSATDQPRALEITRVRVIPHAAAPPAN